MVITKKIIDCNLENTKCNTAVHQACRGAKVIPEGPWYCKPCEQKVPMEDRVCILCPVKGGALKPVQQEGVDQNAKQQDWAHIMCCIWCEETYFADADAMEPIAGVKKVFAKKHANACFICQGDTGAILTCSSPKCKKAFHPTWNTK